MVTPADTGRMEAIKGAYTRLPSEVQARNPVFLASRLGPLRALQAIFLELSAWY